MCYTDESYYCAHTASANPLIIRNNPLHKFITLRLANLIVKKIEAAALAILLIALADSAYLTAEHFGGAPLVCPNIAVINCTAVLGSQYSIVLGIPLAVLGLIWTAVMLFLFIYKSARSVRIVAPVWYLLGAAGVAYSFTAQYLLGRACIYCTTLDIAIILFLVTVYAGAMRV